MKKKPNAANVLFPKVRVELLRLLFAGSQKQYYVRELMMKSGMALGTVQEELAKLRSVDLVRTWSDGYHRFYQANREHPFYPHLCQIVRRK